MTADLISTAPSSRRALLAGALGAAAASVVGAIGRPTPASAVDTLGTFVSSVGSVPAVTAHNSATDGFPGYAIEATTDVPDGAAIRAVAWAGTSPVAVFADATGSQAIGVYAVAPTSSGPTFGVYAITQSDSGVGVQGQSNSSSGNTVGVAGWSYSSDGRGVVGIASSATGATRGVVGRVYSPDGAAIHGYSGPGATPGPIGKTAVYGTASHDGSSAGVRGHAPTDGTGIVGFSGSGSPGASAKTGVYGQAVQDADARGVWGRTTTGRGVYGQASTGQGVRGYAATGAALYGSTSDLKKGLALRTVGRVRLDNSAGIAVIPNGAISVVVTPGIDLVTSSAVTATLMGNPGGTTAVQRVAVDATNDSFTIFLTAANASGAGVKVAWHVFG